MGDTMLHGVLRMPPNCWSGTELDVTQRHSRYIQASERIYELEDKLAQVERERDEAKATLKEALAMAQDMIEINPSNYDHDDVCRLNNEAVELLLFLTNQNKD